jgi:crossover junction endodeoxyribonuclease RuvC
VKILGVDPGIHGGLAIVELNDGAAPELVDVIDIPTIGVGAAERINPHAVQEWLLLHGPTTAIIERARSMPKQGVASTFKYGRATGSIETVIQLCSIPLKFVGRQSGKRFSSSRAKIRNRRVSSHLCGSRPRTLYLRAKKIINAPRQC